MRKAALATVLVAMLAAGSAGALASGPKTFKKTFLINCGTSTPKTAQFCPRPPGTYTLGTITVAAPRVTATYVTSGHCSTVLLWIYVDGKKAAHTAKIGATGTGKVSFLVKSPGRHRISFEEQGFTGGCNAGTLVSIAGTISVAYTH